MCISTLKLSKRLRVQIPQGTDCNSAWNLFFIPCSIFPISSTVLSISIGIHSQERFSALIAMASYRRIEQHSFFCHTPYFQNPLCVENVHPSRSCALPALLLVKPSPTSRTAVQKLLAIVNVFVVR
jgi:hypothetical protein